MKGNNEKIGEVLNSLTGLTGAVAPPYIAGRVFQKIKDRNSRTMWDEGAEMITRPSVAFALVIVVLLLNTYFFSFNLNKEAADASAIYGYSVTDFPIEEVENIWP